jgi:hypothetical protein
MWSDRTRAITNLVLSVLQFGAATFVFGAADFEEASADGPIAAPEDLATPAVYAFAIWFLIYSLSVAYGVLQALPSQRTNPTFRAVGAMTAVTFAGCIAWIVAARFGPAFLTIPLILVMFAAIATALLRALRSPPASRAERVILRPLFGIYTGWLTAAIVLNVTNVLPEYGIGIFGLTGVGLAAFTLTCASVIALALIRATRGHLPYVATLLWAQAAIIVVNLTENAQPLVAAGAGMVTLLVVGSTLLARRA